MSYWENLQPVSIKTKTKGWEKKQTPNPIKWKDMIQEVQLIEKVTHKCGELWELITV